MQVSATSRHCEKNGWGGCLRKSENITKQVHQWEEAIESIPLAKYGDDYGNFLLLWLSVSEHQWHLSCLIWTFELLQLWTKYICPVFMSKWPFLTCFTVTPGTIKTGIPMLWLPGCLSDMDWSPALTPDPPLGAKVLMARATMVAYYTASSCDLRAAWTYKGKRLTEAGGGVGERRQERGYPREQPGFAHWQRQQINFE